MQYIGKSVIRVFVGTCTTRDIICFALDDRYFSYIICDEFNLQDFINPLPKLCRNMLILRIDHEHLELFFYWDLIQTCHSLHTLVLRKFSVLFGFIRIRHLSIKRELIVLFIFSGAPLGRIDIKNFIVAYRKLRHLSVSGAWAFSSTASYSELSPEFPHIWRCLKLNSMKMCSWIGLKQWMPFK